MLSHLELPKPVLSFILQFMEHADPIEEGEQEEEIIKKIYVKAQALIDKHLGNDPEMKTVLLDYEDENDARGARRIILGPLLSGADEAIGMYVSLATKNGTTKFTIVRITPTTIKPSENRPIDRSGHRSSQDEYLGYTIAQLKDFVTDGVVVGVGDWPFDLRLHKPFE